MDLQLHCRSLSSEETEDIAKTVLSSEPFASVLRRELQKTEKEIAVISLAQERALELCKMILNSQPLWYEVAEPKLFPEMVHLLKKADLTTLVKENDGRKSPLGVHPEAKTKAFTELVTSHSFLQRSSSLVVTALKTFHESCHALSHSRFFQVVRSDEDIRSSFRRWGFWFIENNPDVLKRSHPYYGLWLTEAVIEWLNRGFFESTVFKGNHPYFDQELALLREARLNPEQYFPNLGPVVAQAIATQSYLVFKKALD